MNKSFVLLIILLSGCSSQSFTDNLKDQAVEVISGKSFSRNSSSCPTIKSSCPSNKYEEWVQNNGKIACACN